MTSIVTHDRLHQSQINDRGTDTASIHQPAKDAHRNSVRFHDTVDFELVSLHSDSDDSHVDNKYFQEGSEFLRKRRNAIDFSPIDAAAGEEEINNNSELDNELKEDNNNAANVIVLSDYDFVSDSSMIDNYEIDSEPISPDKINFSLSGSSGLENDNDFEDIFDSIGVAGGQGPEQAPLIDQNLFLWGDKDMCGNGKDKNSSSQKTYNAFHDVCHRLSNLPPVHSTKSLSTESLSHPNATPSVRPITAQRLLPQLECCYAYMHGGKDLNDAPIICLPHYPDLRDVTEDDFRDVILYITSVTRACDADVGFVLVVDRRRDKWPSLRGVLVRLAGFFPGCLRMVLVLRPVGFLQGKISNIGFRWRRDEFAMKVPMTMLSGLDELYNYIAPNQLTQEFGGSYEYDHKTWIRNRMLIEDFTSHASEVGMSLELYGTELAETEFPNNISSTQILIKIQEENTNNHKEKIDDLLKAAIALKSTIQTPQGGSIIANTGSSFEEDTLQSIMVLIEETDAAFGKFWSQHEEKLKQCLELRQFEQDYRVVISKLSTFQQWFDNQTNDIGTSVPWVETLICETQRMHDAFVKCKEECILLSERGGVLIDEQHYAIDCIAPKCSEVITVSASINELFQRKTTFLPKARSILIALDELNCWCDRAMSTLAGQTIEKPQTFEGAKQALTELEAVFESKEAKSAIPEDPLPANLKTFVQTANLRHKEVRSIYEKRRTVLKKVIAKHVDRPVQVVEPSKKVGPSTEAVVPNNTDENKERPKSGSMTSSPKRPSSAVTHSSQHPEPYIKLQHVMKELLATEKVYVEELKAIVQGYGEAIDDVRYADIVPEELKGNKRVLLGNMEDIYTFHCNIFLNELEECEDNPSSVGGCFIKRKNEFNIYSEYCQNSARSEKLRSRVGEHHQFFQVCQQKLGHRLPLAAYLLKPVQRITKYQLLLQQILKYSNQHLKELQNAVQAMLAVLKSVNDSMHETAVCGYQTDLDSLGKLYMQGQFSMQIDHKKTKVKNLARPRFSKTVQRHLFLYEKELLFCKQQSTESSATDNGSSSNVGQSTSSLGGSKGYHYQFKNSIKMNAVGITETLKGDPRKFEIWYQGREDVYTLLAASVLVKQDWVREIKKILSSQPKSETTPPEPRTADAKKPTKAAKRSESLNKKIRPSGYARDTPKPDKSNDTKKKSTLIRSASMGKGKDKQLRRKIIDDSSGKASLTKITDDDDERAEGDAFNAKRKSRSLPRLANPPQSLTDTEDASDDSTTASSCPFIVMKERTKILDDGEVILHVGDDVDILEKGKEGWVKVRVHQSGKEGWAPTNHITSSFGNTSSVLAS